LKLDRRLGEGNYKSIPWRPERKGVIWTRFSWGGGAKGAHSYPILSHPLLLSSPLLSYPSLS